MTLPTPPVIMMACEWSSGRVRSSSSCVPKVFLMCLMMACKWSNGECCVAKSSKCGMSNYGSVSKRQCIRAVSTCTLLLFCTHWETEPDHVLLHVLRITSLLLNANKTSELQGMAVVV